MSKRPSPPTGISHGAGGLIKRAKSGEQQSNQLIISSAGDDKKGLIRTVQRTSNLEAPIISLFGAHSVRRHPSLDNPNSNVSQAEILSCRFDPTGQNIAACSADRSICKSSFCLASISQSSSPIFRD